METCSVPRKAAARIFFFPNGILLTKKTETANIYIYIRVKKRGNLVIGRDENVNFSREIDIVCAIGHVFVCFVPLLLACREQVLST